MSISVRSVSYTHLDVYKRQVVCLTNEKPFIIRAFHYTPGTVSYTHLDVYKRQEVNRGDVIAIIGQSGCGKSTFLRSLNLLETPTSVQILFEGTDLTDKSTDINLTRQKIGMVFQQFNLFANMTIKANIMLAPVKLGVMTKDEASNKADELLTRIGLLDKADAYQMCIRDRLLRTYSTCLHTQRATRNLLIL